MRKCFLAVGVALWISSSVLAQSILSIQYPFGLPLAHSTGPSLSLGGAGAGVKNDFFGMADNPGNLGGIDRAVFSGTGVLENLNLSQNGNSSSIWAFTPRLLSFSFPMGKVGAFGFSFDQRTSANRRFLDQRNVVVNGDTVVQSIGMNSEGGLKAWQIGWGRSFKKLVYGGISYERMYVTVNDVRMMGAEIGSGSLPTGLAQPRYDSASLTFRGNAFRAGILVPLKKVTLGMSGEYIFDGSASSTESSTEDTSATGKKRTEFTIGLPPSLTFGLSYAFSPEWMAAASITGTAWQEYWSSQKLSGPVDNAGSFSLGTQFIPAPNLLVPRYYEIIQYSAGFRYSQLPANTASEFAFNLGVGLPLVKGGGLFNCMLEYGRRSDSRFSGYSENYFRVLFGVNGGRRWFQKTENRY